MSITRSVSLMTVAVVASACASVPALSEKTPGETAVAPAGTAELPVIVAPTVRGNMPAETSQHGAAQACVDGLETCPKVLEVSAPESIEDLDEEGEHFPTYHVGEPLSFVCSGDYPPVGRLKGRPNLQLMWEHYIHQTPRGVWSEIGGLVEVNGCLDIRDGGWRNACTVRLSHMLNHAGLRIPKMKGKTVTGGTGDNYLFRLHDAEAFLRQQIGPPELEFTDGLAWAHDLPNRPGLVIMNFPSGEATGHATIWNGAGTVDSSAIGGTKVMFWDLPCFLPEGRQTGQAAEAVAGG